MRLIGPYSVFLDRTRAPRPWRVQRGGSATPWPWIEIDTRLGTVILCRSRPRTWPRSARWGRLVLLCQTGVRLVVLWVRPTRVGRPG